MKAIETRDFSELHQMLETGYFVHHYINKPEQKHYHKIYKAGKDDYVLAALDKETGEALEYSVWHYKSLSNLLYQHHISWTMGKSWLWVEVVKPEIGTLKYEYPEWERGLPPMPAPPDRESEASA